MAGAGPGDAWGAERRGRVGWECVLEVSVLRRGIESGGDAEVLSVLWGGVEINEQRCADVFVNG